MAQVLTLSIEEIHESPVALRPVDTQGEAFMGLTDSIRQQGLMNPPNVRVKDVDGRQEYFLVDGLHRFTACKEIGMTEIPVNVLDIDEAGVLSAQIAGNVHKVETKPVEYSKQIYKILAHNPTMTVSQLAVDLCKSPKWLHERLGLLKLVDRAQELVDDDKINLSNAYSLARLPPEEQADWVDRAITDSPNEFMPNITARVKEIREARKEGRDAAAAVFIPVARLRKMAELKAELEEPKIADIVVAQNEASSATEGFTLGIQWALNLDTSSVEAAKAKDEERKRLRAEAAEARKKERLDKKAKDAAEEAEAAAE